MIGLTLLSHQWKGFWRSRNTGKGIALQIVVGIFILYLLGVAIAGGLILRQTIIRSFPGRDPAAIFYRGLLYYFLADMLTRFNFQDLPTLSIQPYLAQNIRRRYLIRFLNIRSLFHFLNLVPLVLMLPFVFAQIGSASGGRVVTAFVLSIVSLTAFNHFLIMYIKRRTIQSGWWILGFIGALVLCAAGDYFRLFSLARVSETLFTGIQHHPVLALIPFGMAIVAYFNNYRYLYNSLYLEDIVRKTRKRKGMEYGWLNRFGDLGDLVALDLKLIFRNKRPRSTVAMSWVFLLYGFIFYKPRMIAGNELLIPMFGAIFMIGFFVVQYGQFLFAWQSSHIDGLMAGRLSLRTYIKGKLFLLNGVSAVLFLISTVYAFMGWKILVLELAAFFYNIGFQSVMAAWIATYSYKAIDISRKAQFNYQGLGASQWLLALAMFAVPTIFYLICKIFHNDWITIGLLGVLGLISFLMQDWWADIITRQFQKRKYLILEGFREK